MARHALAAGSRFAELEILRVLGVGGHGIVYLARDHALARNVALKEYMPAAVAARGVGAQVIVCCPSLAQSYAFGLHSFVNEARLLARFDHPSLVKVHRFWEENGTAYMVMPYLDGVMLSDVRRSMSSPPEEGWIRRVVDSILSALELLHREGVYHRDIAPDNILLPAEGPPVLLDFGAARHSIGDTQSFSTTLRLDYAPIEQFAGVKQRHQGPWTDLYALGAVMHFLVFGAPPAPATERAVDEDAAVPIADRSAPGISVQLIEAMAWALALWPNGRPQSAKALRDALDGRIAVPASARRRIASPVGLALARAGETLTAMARGQWVPMQLWPLPFEVKRVDWSYSPGLRRQQSSSPAGASPGAPPPPATMPSFAPPPLPAAMAQAGKPPQAHTRSHLGLALSLLGFVLVGVAIAYLTPEGRRDAAGLVSAPRPVHAVALAPPAQTTSIDPLATTTDPAAAASAGIAALPARAEPERVSPPVTPARAAARTPSSARTAVSRSSSLRARTHLSLSARRGAVRSGKLAKAPARRGSSIAAAAPHVTRSTPGLEAVADVPIVTSNAYVERSADAGILSLQGRGPAPPDRPDPTRRIAGAGTGAPSSAQEACRGRWFIAWAVCLERQCRKLPFRDSAECTRMLDDKRARER